MIKLVISGIVWVVLDPLQKGVYVMCKEKKCEHSKFRLHVEFCPKTKVAEKADFFKEFFTEIEKTKLTACLAFRHHQDDELYKIKIACCDEKKGMPCAGCLWELYVYTANSTFPNVKEIMLVDETGKRYPKPIPFYPVRVGPVS